MTGFPAEWLALREPADHAATNARVRAAVTAHFKDRQEVHIVDLGCGAGSNLRGTYAALPNVQHWTLVDYDPALLAAARAAIARWADVVVSDGTTLHVMKQRRSLHVSFREADLARGAHDVIAPGTDLVTAAALFDLCSAPWIERFVALLAARGLPLFTVLTYDGNDRFDPPHPLDPSLLAAFHQHMCGDKGFGAAAGPNAARVLVSALETSGYRVTSGDSPWVLEGDSKLAVALATGFTAAVKETGRIEEDAVDTWLARRIVGGTWETGHTDIFGVRG
jgi:SAM-dependent methyltransferase